MEPDQAEPRVRRLRLLLEYDGTDFRGWQSQVEARTVQSVLEQHIRQLTGERVRVTGASRTDAGVHARGQVAHFDSSTRLSAAELMRGLNAVLPRDIAVLALAEAAPDFQAQRDAVSKRYLYRILVGPAPHPLLRRESWHVRGPLDLPAMERAAKALLGRHDFAAFRGSPGGAPPRQTTLRTLERLELACAGPEVQLAAEARGFLRYMVRNLAGTLVAIGLGRMDAGAIPEILASRQRGRAGPTAPARGLCLLRVRYPGESEESART